MSLQSVQQDVPLAGMMTGISEVTIPLEQRLKRIEETEAAKRGMLAAASKRSVLVHGWNEALASINYFSASLLLPYITFIHFSSY